MSNICSLISLHVCVLTPQCCRPWTRSAPRCTGRGGGARAARRPARTGRRLPPCCPHARSRHTHILRRQHKEVKLIVKRQSVITTAVHSAQLAHTITNYSIRNIWTHNLVQYISFSSSNLIFNHNFNYCISS